MYGTANYGYAAQRHLSKNQMATLHRDGVVVVGGVKLTFGTPNYGYYGEVPSPTETY